MSKLGDDINDLLDEILEIDVDATDAEDKRHEQSLDKRRKLLLKKLKTLTKDQRVNGIFEEFVGYF